MAQEEEESSNYKFLKAKCKRMLSFIQFHIAYHVFEQKEAAGLIKDA